MRLTSTSFPDGGVIAARYGKRAENVSPQLSWEDVPDGTVSLLLTVTDLHPVARGYVHWVVADIDPSVGGFDEGAAGALPSGRETTPYAGPFPPSGTHEYEFTLLALSGGAPRFDALPWGGDEESTDSIDDHILATARYSGHFTVAPLG